MDIIKEIGFQDRNSGGEGEENEEMESTSQTVLTLAWMMLAK